MKPSSLKILIALLLLGLFPLALHAEKPSAAIPNTSAKNESSPIEVGWGRVEITPPIGIPLSGYGKRKGKPSQRIHDPLYCRALAVTRGEDRLIFVSADLVLIDQKMRSTVLKKIRKQIPIQDSELILTATHTHSGAGAIGGRFWERFIMGKFRKRVFERVSSGIAQSVLDALSKKVIASAQIAETDVSDLIENRLSDKIRVPRRLKVLRFISQQRAEGRGQSDLKLSAPSSMPYASVVAHLIFMAAHPTILPASNMDFSADFPGELNRFLEKDYPDSISLMINGASADLRTKTASYPTHFQTMEAYGFALAEKVKSLSYAPAVLNGPWKSEIKKVSLPNTRVRAGAVRIPFLIGNRVFPSRSYFQAARMGSLMFLTFPGELGSETGASIEALAVSRKFQPFLVGFANDYIAYVIPQRFYLDKTQYESQASFYGKKMDFFVQKQLDELTLNLMSDEEKSIVNPPGVRRGTQKLPALYLTGDPYHVGFEEGRLLRDEIQSGVDSIFDYLRSELPVPLVNHLLINNVLDRAWNKMSPYVSYHEYIQMKGVADGAGVSFKKIKRIHALPEVFPTFCANSAFWDKATSDGKMIAIRNLDWNRKIGVHNHAAIKFIRIPGKQNYVNIGYQGFTGVLSGLNEKGISVGQIGASSSDETMKGVGMPFLLKRILEEASSLEEIKTLFEISDLTRGYNYVFADALTKDALVVEATHHHTAFFKANDPQEKQIAYASPMESCVLRSDTAIDPTIRELQTASKGDPEKPGLEAPAGSAYEIRYKKHADLIQKNYGNITPDIAKKIAKEIAPGSNIQSVVYAYPEFWVANAEGAERAVDSEYTKFNFESIEQRA